MIGHLGIYVDDILKSDDFYRPLLEVIGYATIISVPQCRAYGKNGIPFFEIYTGKPKTSPIHVAFMVDSKELVEAFYRTGLSLGAQDNGAPGYRHYFPNYYASFLIDHHGHNLEALYFG